MKNKKWNLLLPLLLVFFIFLLDKVALVPAFQKCCTQYRGNPFSQSLDYNFSQDAIIQLAKKENKKIILNLGTSRSMGYYQTPTEEHIKQTRFLSVNQKKAFNKIRIINSSTPGASIISTYVRMNQWLDHGFRPDVIWVEISPFSFNKNGMWTWFEIKHAIPWDFAVKYALEMPANHTKQVLTSRIFATSRFRLGKVDQGLTNWERLFKSVTANLDQAPKGMPGFDGFKEGAEPAASKMLFDYVATEMQRTMFGNYKLDKVYTRYLYLIVARAQTEKIPIVIWIPPSHSIWHKVLDSSNDRNHWRQDWKGLIDKTKKMGASYIDMDLQGQLKCRYFKDPVHIDIRCFPEMASKKLQISGL